MKNRPATAMIGILIATTAFSPASAQQQQQSGAGSFLGDPGALGKLLDSFNPVPALQRCSAPGGKTPPGPACTASVMRDMTRKYQHMPANKRQGAETARGFTDFYAGHGSAMYAPLDTGRGDYDDPSIFPWSGQWGSRYHHRPMRGVIPRGMRRNASPGAPGTE